MFRNLFCIALTASTLACATTPRQAATLPALAPAGVTLNTTAERSYEPARPATPAASDFTLNPTILASAPVEAPLAAAFLASAPAAPADDDGGRHNSFFTGKLGYYGADADNFDGGYILNLAWARYFTRLLALELELGYFSDDGDNSDLWGVPIMVNGRVSIPVWILELYGGIGVGGIYYDVEAGPFEDDGFLLGGNAFLGADIAVADTLVLGLEAKTYLTEDIDDTNENLDALAVMLTFGYRH